MRREQRADKDHGTAQTVAEAKTLANGEGFAAQSVAWPIKLFVAQCREKNDTHHTTHTTNSTRHITYNTNTTHTQQNNT